mmetsp:Transcript_29972/g.42131  ORF Transcript_29972/g.42131 Transcript_29972/m.42131 type:complete len:672 (+) Transcript_29972:75-2090(+)
MAQYSRRAQLSCLAICVLICLQIVSSTPSDYFSNTDRATIKNLLDSSQKKDGSFLGLKNTFYAVSAYQALGQEPKQKDKICEYAKGALKTVDTESIFYQVSILESLSCGQQVDDKVKTAIKNSFTSNNLADVLNGVSAALVLRKGKHIDVSSTELQSAYNKILSFNDEGLFKAKSDADTSVVLTGETLHVLSQIASSGDNAKLTTLLNNAVDALFTLAEDTKTTFSFVDDESKASPVHVTASVWRGINSLARAVNAKPKAVTQKEVPRIAEYFVQQKHAHTVEGAYYVLEGLNNIANNQFFTPLVVTLAQGTTTESTIKVRVTDVYGNKATKSQVTLVKAYTDQEKNKPFLTNQEVTAVDDTTYQLSLGATKPEAGFYNLEFRVTPSDNSGKFVGVDSAVRKLKVLGAVSVSDAQLTVAASADSDDVSAGKKYKPTFGKQLDDVVALKSGEHLFLHFNLKSGSGKAMTAQQVFIRIANDQFETILPVKGSTKGYTAHINPEDLDDFYGESGVYTVDLIVGDSFIQNPFQWTVAKVQITFTGSHATRPENPFNAKPEIKHMFRAPDRRASPFLSFVFTIAALAPWAVLVIGLPLVGANIRNFPIGTHTPFAFAFQGCLGLVLLLIAYYWFGFANMFQTLQTIGLVLIPGVFFAIQTLNHLATKSAASKKKTE